MTRPKKKKPDQRLMSHDPAEREAAAREAFPSLALVPCEGGPFHGERRQGGPGIVIYCFWQVGAPLDETRTWTKSHETPERFDGAQLAAMLPNLKGYVYAGRYEFRDGRNVYVTAPPGPYSLTPSMTPS